MFDLSVITTALTSGAPSLSQIIIPESQETQTLDSSSTLVTLVEPQISNRIYPVLLPNEPTYPCAIYQQSASDRVDVDGYPILREDDYLVAVESTTHTESHSTAENIRTALLAYDPTNAAGSVSLLDKSDGYDEDFELFETALLVRMTHLARNSQALPAAFVYSLGESWEPDEAITCVIGQAVSRFAVLLVAKMPAGGVSALTSTRDEILNAVIGLRPSGWGYVEPEGGDLLAVHSSHVLWRDVFSVMQTRQYSISEV